MIHPVLRGIRSQGEVPNLGLVDAVIELKEDAETRFGEK